MPAKELGKVMAKAAAVPEFPEVKHGAGSVIARSLAFLGEVRSEMGKVTTPSRAEVQSTTLVVVFAVFFFAAFFWIVDLILNFVLQGLMRWLGGA